MTAKQLRAIAEELSGAAGKQLGHYGKGRVILESELKAVP
jgi:hypothetical protein